MFLLPTTTFNESYGVPYWTLIFEMAFYAVMYVLALFGISEKRGASILLVWGVAIAFLCQLQIHPDFSNIDRMPFAGWWIFVSPENLMFIAGAIYGLVGQDRFKRTSPLSLGIHAGTLFFISETLPMPPYVRFLTWGVAYLCLLDLARRVRFPAFMERAGDYSYGIYLTQTILINSAMAAMLILAPHAALASYVAIALIAPVVGGLFFGAMEFHFHARAIKPVLRHL
jgi:peptidoglycan/LPS O-acetylase OafA/YrhL